MTAYFRAAYLRSEDWTSLDVDAVPMIHPNTVGLT